MRELAQQVRDLLVAVDHYRHAMATAIGAGVPETTTLVQIFVSGPMTPTAIAEALGMTTASVTGLLDRLVAAGFVTRSPNPLDRRSVLVSLTENGRRAGNAIFELFSADVVRALDGISESERAALVLLLDQLTVTLRQRVAEPDLPTQLDAHRKDAAAAVGQQKARLPD